MIGLVVVGGGSSARFGADKLRLEIAGKTVFEHSLERLKQAFPDAPVVAVASAGALSFWGERLHPDRLIAGGERRQDSVRNGVEAVEELGATRVLIHDAARPAVDPEDVRRLAPALERAPGALLVAPVVDTVKRIDGDRVVGTVDRSTLVRALTPQAFRIAELKRAWSDHPEIEATDEVMLLEALGLDVLAVLAEHPNPKLTHPSDLQMLRSLLET